MAPPALVCDIEDWDDQDFFYLTQRANTFLAQKGFCVIRSNLERRVRLGAQKEARRFRKESALTRVPREALSSLLGETASCWTKELVSPEEQAVPTEQQNLRKVDKRLEAIGMCIGSSCHLHCSLDLLGRSRGLLHHSKMPEDRPAPPLIDLEEAVEYMERATAKKVSLLYFLGPSPATLTITPRDYPKKAYEAALKEDVIIAYRADACTLSYATRGFAVAVEVDFIARMKSGLREGPKDALPCPADLGEWYDERLKQAATAHTADDSFEHMPLDFVRDAKLSYFTKEPIVIYEMWYDLPSVPLPEDSGLTPIQAVILGGQDVVTQIASPSETRSLHYPLQMPVLSGAKWEMSEYYSVDPSNDSDYKIYTKHLSVLSRDSPGDCPSFKEFGLTHMEDASLDHRARMLYEAHYMVQEKALIEHDHIVGKDMGFFVGLSGQSMSLLFRREARINKHTISGMSHSAMVSRLSYYFNSKGPTQAIDAEDASGACAMESGVQYLTKEDPGYYSFVSAASYIDGPLETILQCASGIVSHSGRSRAFDESSDGFVKGEGVICFLLSPLVREDGKNVNEKVQRPTILGSAVNSKGQSSSLAAPNGPALVDVVRRAARDAHIPFEIVDAVEANATGNPLADLMELGAMRDALEGGERMQCKQAVPLRAMKSTYGNLGAPNGLVAIARTCALLERGLHGPNLHLHQLFDTAALSADGETEFSSRLHFLSEVIESKSISQFVGVSTFGSTGTNVHQILWGTVHSDHTKAYGGKPLSWWPAEDPKAGKQPMFGYYICGTMTAWSSAELMEDEGEGVYGYTLTMGDNNWECFQIMVDQDEERVLHPTQVRAFKDTKIVGPESGVGRELCWCISGMTKQVRLINEEQAEMIKTATDQAVASGEAPPEYDIPCALTFPGNGGPAGYEGGKAVEEMPILTLNHADAGKPGDKYRIRLYVRGKFKRLTWTKATGLDALTLEEERPFTHEYRIIGDHNYWVFEPMAQDPSEPGLFTAEIQLLKEKSSFQIYRDGDWEQGFYPAVPSASADADIQGPDERGHGLNWQVRGKVGDICRIEFRRKVSAESEMRSMSWSYVRSEEVDFAKLAEGHTYSLAGTWTDFKQCDEMLYDEDEDRYALEIRVGRTGQESFQILLNSNWLSTVHPNFNDATIFGDDGHTTEGPDDDGAGKYWTIGLRPEEGIACGDLVTIYMDMSEGLPKRVWWTSEKDMFSHQIKLAAGLKRVFERHCRLMDIPTDLLPYSQEKIKKIKVPDLNPELRRHVEKMLLEKALVDEKAAESMQRVILSAAGVQPAEEGEGEGEE